MEHSDCDGYKRLYEANPYLGRPKMSLTLSKVSESPVFCTRVNYSPATIKGELTLVKSSLILMHGRPLIDAILITMLSALLFSLPPLDKDLKSFVKKVPIPKAAAHGLNHATKENILMKNLRFKPSSSHCFLRAIALSTLSQSEYTMIFSLGSMPSCSYTSLARGPKTNGSPESCRKPCQRRARCTSAVKFFVTGMQRQTRGGIERGRWVVVGWEISHAPGRTPWS